MFSEFLDEGLVMFVKVVLFVRWFDVMIRWLEGFVLVVNLNN